MQAEKLELAIDSIRVRFGSQALTRAAGVRSQSLWDGARCGRRRAEPRARPYVELQSWVLTSRLDLGTRPDGWSSSLGAVREKPRGPAAGRGRARDSLSARQSTALGLPRIGRRGAVSV